MGTGTPVYGWLFHVFPPMQGLRAAARFGNLFLLGMAVLAGFGAARVRRPALAIALIVLVNAEALRAPFTYQPYSGIPPLYAMLRDEPDRSSSPSSRSFRAGRSSRTGRTC
jgi:hypothetical protein